MRLDIDHLKYPIGLFRCPSKITPAHLSQWRQQIASLPQRIENLVTPLSEHQLDTPYRPGGWTVRQVVHHIADSHTNSYIRFKWALTENTPVIKAYDEQAWAELFDTKAAPIELSVTFLKALHLKWVYLLEGLSEKQLGKKFVHPSTHHEVSLEENIGIYAWHGEHHYMHIKNLLEREGWL